MPIISPPATPLPPSIPTGINSAALELIPDLIKKSNLQSVALSPKGFFQLFLQLFVSKSSSGLLSNDKILPKEIPFATVAGFGATLLNSGTAGKDMQGLWGLASSAGSTEVSSVVSQLVPGVNGLSSALARIPFSAVDVQGMQTATSAIEQFFKLSPSSGGGNATIIQSELEQICNSLGLGSRAIFSAYDAAGNFKASVGDLSQAVEIPALILVAAGNCIASTSQFPSASMGRDLSSSGIAGIQDYLQTIHGIANQTFNGPCSPTSLQELTVIRQACLITDDLYFNIGSGSVDWGNLTAALALQLGSSEILRLAQEAGGFTAFTSDELTVPIINAVDDALRYAFCHGGSDNLANATTNKIIGQFQGAITAAETVATIYASAHSISSSFAAGMTAMRDVGAGNAFSSVMSGQIGQLMNLNPETVLGVTSQVDSIRALAQGGSAPSISALVEDYIGDFITKNNLGGHMKVGVADALFHWTDNEDKLKAQINLTKNLFT